MMSEMFQEIKSNYPSVIEQWPENTAKFCSNVKKCSKETGSFAINYLKKIKEKFHNEQIWILFILTIVAFLTAISLSLPAPFYPKLATAKGASATEYGLVFGIFELTAIIASPLFGAHMKILGPKRLFTGGILSTGICSIIFGLLKNIDGRWVFISSCLFVRILAGVANSAYATASFTFIGMTFPGATATIFAIMETFFCLGAIVGPVLGGFVYELGGFSLPFIMIGGFLLVFSLITRSSLQTEDSKVTDDEVNDYKNNITKIFEVHKAPMIAMTSYILVVVATGDGFLLALLESHLRQFGLSKMELGSVFILSHGVYGISSPFWGYACDHGANLKLITIFGVIVSVLGLALIGPLPFLPFHNILGVICLGQILVGLGKAAVYVSGMKLYLNDAINRGYPEDESTYGFVSGLWTAMTAMGYFIGPTAGGILEDHIGFRGGSLFLIWIELIIMMVIIIIFLVKTHRKEAVEFKAREAIAAEIIYNRSFNFKSWIDE